MSHGWWRERHNRHHAAPNQAGRDPDIGPGAIAFTAEIADARATGFPGWFVRHQGWLFFPLLTLEGFNLHADSVRTVLRRGPVPYQRLEAALVVMRLVAFVVVLLVAVPPGKAAAFLGVQYGRVRAVPGWLVRAQPQRHADRRIDGDHRFPATPGADVPKRPRRLCVDAAMGGLNYQIEHHLFPSMPRPNLKRAQPIVRAYCIANGVNYSEVGLFESYGIVVSYLNAVGLQARGPFDCPVASTFRD